MKISSLLFITSIATVLALGSPAFAAKGGKKNKGDKADPASRYDANGNGKIDPGPETEAIAKAFDSDKNGALKKYDTNHNGNLEKSEIEAIHVPIHAKK